MAGYSSIKITGNSSGLIQSRENFLLPNDAYPVLQNAYVWRERILRKKGYQLLGRLTRSVTATGTSSSSPIIFNLYTFLSITEPTATIMPGSISMTLGSETFTDNGNGFLPGTPTGAAFVNYITGAITITTTEGPGNPLSISLNYYPGLPVMGIRTQELDNSANDQTIFFDQTYAYIFNGSSNQFQEFIPGTTWNAHNGNVYATDFFWSTNYWLSDGVNFGSTGIKLFWETNNTGQFGSAADPPRITDGITWLSWWTIPGGTFTPSTWSQIDSGPTYLVNWLSMLPYRGRMVVFNTWEGLTAADSQNYSNRIRWSTIGNPFIAYAAGPPATGSWRDDIRGQGGYLDIPTSEDIISIGFVRDNLVIYCERSTWQLRYTGRAISPFQIEKVNSELGGSGPISSVQFDTSLVGIGDKGIVECDSYKSERIDIKIPDYVFEIQNTNNGPFRIHGIRDFINRLAFWTVPINSLYDPKIDPSSQAFPNQRLVYNYENDSWALFSDSLTAIGNYQPQETRTWINTLVPWIRCNFSWIGSQSAEIPSIVGGNQQGFIEYLDELTTNDVSLYISDITANTTTPTIVTSPNHNMQTGFVIGISGIPSGTPFDNLNGGVFGIIVNDANNFQLMLYNPEDQKFSTPQLDVPTTAYIGGGLIDIRDNFSIISKKFNFMDEGQSIQFGYLDILMSASEPDQQGAISLNVYIDYDDENASNTFPKNQINGAIPPVPDTFFNSIIPTSPSNFSVAPAGSKFWQRVFCATRANFITLQYTFSNGQMAGIQQELKVQIDAQNLWMRPAGRLTNF